MASKPKVIILGGCGFIGRNLVSYLLKNNLVSKIRVVDKMLPDLAGLSSEQLKLFKSENVEFKQANLARESMVTKAFADEQFDFAFNLAGETKFGQTTEVYKESIEDVSTNCGKAAAKVGVKRFIEVSTAQIYSSGSKASVEGSKEDPWTKLAKAKLAAEKNLREIKGLPLIIVRPSAVYGPGDTLSIMPRLIAAAVYKHLGEKMEFLWDGDLKLNTVHVSDVVVALWHLATNGTLGEVYNLADTNETTQGSLNKLFEKMFGIKTGFLGNIQSKVATGLAAKTVADNVNEKHLKPWSDLCKQKGITNTPLTPYLDEELLYNNALSVDGKKITTTGFTYQVPTMSTELLFEQLNYFIELGFFPKGVTV